MRPRYNKYGNQRHNGHMSKKEADIAQKLAIIAGARKIENLREQVPFELFQKRGKLRAVKYIADFTFMENGKLVVMDAKGCRTQVFKLKKRMMLELLGIEVEEV